MIKKIESKSGKMSETHGKDREFLGMNMKYKDKKVQVGMNKHILKAIDTFYDDITRNTATPATSYLFNTRDVPKLDKEKANNFHSMKAPLLFIS